MSSDNAQDGTSPKDRTDWDGMVQRIQDLEADNIEMKRKVKLLEQIVERLEAISKRSV